MTDPEELKPNSFWDEWQYNRDNNKPVFFIKHLINLFGCRIDVHKMVSPDNLECYHSHPAHAIRIILWGGYTEEIVSKNHVGGHKNKYEAFWPFKFGWVTPDFTHRIEGILNGKSSYSLWIRFRKVKPINLVGRGWNNCQPSKEK